MRMNRRGESGPVGWGQVAIVVYLIWMAIITIVLIYNMHGLKLTDTQLPPDAFAVAYRSRIMLAKDCLAAEEQGRTLAWTMDWARFADPSNLRRCLPFQDGTAYNLTLIRSVCGPGSSGTISCHDERRSVWHEQYSARPNADPLSYPVFIRDAGTTSSGTLLVEAT